MALSRVCLTSILRLYYSRKVVVEAADETYWQFFLGAGLYVEVFIGIIVGCMPTLPKFSQHIKAVWKRTAEFQPRNSEALVLRGTIESRSVMDSFDMRRYLNESSLQVENRSTTELGALKSHSPSTHGSLV